MPASAPSGMNIRRPQWLLAFEDAIGSRLPLRSEWLSGMKIVVLLPLLLCGTRQIALWGFVPALLGTFFLFYTAVDYLAGVQSRRMGLPSKWLRLLDRGADFPLLLVVCWFLSGFSDSARIPTFLLGLKILFDGTRIYLTWMGKGGGENRIRTGLSYATLTMLFAYSQLLLPEMVTSESVTGILCLNLVFSLIAILYRLKILQKRFVADSLSGANLLCGIFSMYFASTDRVQVSLLFLMLGAAFDGFDGAAARKFGGTRWGVYSDDVADGVNYGIAPGVALAFILGGWEGILVGLFYSFFTISRLVFFTLNKQDSDPEYFCGVPSTVGALVVLCSLILFESHPVLLGLMVGVACIQMVSFDTHYRHLGRALASNRRVIYGMPFFILLLLLGNVFWHTAVSVALILLANLMYGFLPTLMHFLRLKRSGDTVKV